MSAAAGGAASARLAWRRRFHLVASFPPCEGIRRVRPPMTMLVEPPHPMTLHLPTLLLTCVAVLGVSATVMTLFGVTQTVYRGFWCWVAAQWLLVAGLALHGLRSHTPDVLPVANLLMLQWPVLVLAGMRRFYSRHGLGVPASFDWLLLALAYTIWLAAWAAGANGAVRIVAFAGGSMLLHFYGAMLTSRMAEFATSNALKMLVAVELAVGLANGLRLAYANTLSEQSPAPGDLLLASGLLILVSAMVLVYLGLLLTYERTEHKLRASHRKLRYLADIDMLTRMPNRRYFYERARRALLEPGAPAAVMMFDVDHFKKINDLLGHASGDEALRQVAAAVREALRKPDLAGRLGGDEFAVLLPATSGADAMAVARRIVGLLEHRQVAPRVARVSLSFGIVQSQPGETIEETLRRADQALYEAKRQGRSRAVAASGAEDKPVFGESQAMGLGPS